MKTTRLEYLRTLARAYLMSPEESVAERLLSAALDNELSEAGQEALLAEFPDIEPSEGAQS